MSVLILAEHNHTQLSSGTLSTVAAATKLGKPIQLLIAGYQCQAVIEQAKGISVLSKILVADSDNYQHFIAESIAPLINHVFEVEDPVTHLLAPATTFGKNILPRVAAMRRVSQVSDIIAIIDHQTYQRPIYAGNAIATVRSKDTLQVLTVRPTAFKPTEISEASSSVTIIPIDFVAPQKQASFVSIEQHESNRPDLATADIVISGGRGLSDQQTFDRLAAIADRLHAALGASRAAVDAGLAPNDWQVGQTGKVVAPKLYIAVGISGAVQHIAGMKDSQVVVAINKDPDAPIFEVADYGLVADIAGVLPEWESAIDDIKKQVKS